MSTRDLLIVAIIIMLVLFFFPTFVPRIFTGGVGLVLLIVLIIVLVKA